MSTFTPPKSAYDIYIKHFSAPRSGTEVFLYDEISSLFPNLSVTITQNYNFDLKRYAKESPESVVFKHLDNLQAVSKVQYRRPKRRRDGEGQLRDEVIFGGWDLTWRGKDFKIILAKWKEVMGQQVTQWHVIVDDAEEARNLIQTVSAYCSTPRNVIWVFEQGQWRPEHSLWDAVQKASWDDVVIDPELKRQIQQDYQSFFNAEDIFKDLGVPWKRGMILLGPPGNGKTISLKAIIKEADVPALYVKSFRGHQGEEAGIREIFVRARSEAPCILVLEDLDSLINDQNRAFFLNEIGTTNHFERLDPALSNRPSRFDRKYTFPNPSGADRTDYATYWQNKLRTKPNIDFPQALVNQFADNTNGFSFAYMKEAFVSALLVIASKKTDSVDTLPFSDILLSQVSHLRDQLANGGGDGMASSWAARETAGSGTGSQTCVTVGMRPGNGGFELM
ncbi:hypothetical protein CI109_102046 [Kwoniella shandongensis]|uniref:AAA+ ATPase domain-containing protein n=1 Tax=Kwoniella shandongensis TaxID=1734106 RepID=A0AAJ8MVJ0_9TREE